MRDNRQNAAVLETPSRSRHAVGGRATLPNYKPIPESILGYPEPFWDRVDVDMYNSEACWPWRGHLTDGYGRFRGFRPHRISYTLVKGPIPEGLSLDHLCRNRACCNPDHLEAVPIGVNIKRGGSPSAIRSKQARCKRGHTFTPANTRLTVKGQRVCLECRRAQQREESKRRGRKSGGKQTGRFCVDCRVYTRRYRRLDDGKSKHVICWMCDDAK
jgi:hypothetical protein